MRPIYEEKTNLEMKRICVYMSIVAVAVICATIRRDSHAVKIRKIKKDNFAEYCDRSESRQTSKAGCGYCL